MPQNPMMGKGPLRHSNKVRTAHDSVASNDVDDFDRGGYPGKRHIDVEANPVKVIAEFSRLGEALRRTGTFREVAEQIARISEMAENTVMQEAGDWFDAQTIKRNMKELGSYSKDFGKLAEEMDAMQQRATALYDDMGNVLSRYFELAGPAAEEAEEAPFGGKKAPKFDGPGGNPADDRGRSAWDARSSIDANDADFGGKQAPAFDGPGGNPADDAGRKAWDVRDGEEDDSDDELEEGGPGSGRRDNGFKKRYGVDKTTVAKRKLDPKSRGRIPGGMTKSAARSHLRRAGENVGANESAVAPNSYNARRALRLPRAQQRIQGGFTRDQAKDILRKEGAKTVSEAKKCLYKEIMRLAESNQLTEAQTKVVNVDTFLSILKNKKFRIGFGSHSYSTNDPPSFTDAKITKGKIIQLKKDPQGLYDHPRGTWEYLGNNKIRMVLEGEINFPKDGRKKMLREADPFVKRPS